MRRLALCVLVLAFFTAASTAEAAGLSVKRARSAAYALTKRVGTAEGASYAAAGYCKRRSARHVNCWGAIVFSDGTAAAQRIKVVKRRRVKAARYGRVYTGTVTDSGGGGGANDEWAVCTSGGFCVGS